VPFALFYLIDRAGELAQLAATVGLAAGTPGAPRQIDLTAADSGWPLCRVVESGASLFIEDLVARVGPMPSGPWPDSPQQALVLPLAQAGQEQLAGFLIAGISPRLVCDDDYRGFLGLLADQMAAAIADARAYEAERQRADALAELDRAKTAFFSDVSHEFRTPLTLMLGPLEQVLSAGDGALTLPQRAELEIVHRNGLRLLKLVNTLLDSHV
jgi:signal transduction histidine kinase